MRLTKQQHQTILQETKKHFGDTIQVRLFGSRINDHLKGGDIDLLLECPEPIPNIAELTRKLVVNLKKLLGDRKIDIIYVWPGFEKQLVHHIALNTGHQL